MPTVAIVGASNDRRKFGNKALRAFRDQGYTVVPVNPRETEVEGERAYARLSEYPGAIDEVSVYVPASAGVLVMDEIAAKGIKTIWLNPGADDPQVIARAQALRLHPTVACSILGVGKSPADY